MTAGADGEVVQLLLQPAVPALRRPHLRVEVHRDALGVLDVGDVVERRAGDHAVLVAVRHHGREVAFGVVDAAVRLEAVCVVAEVDAVRRACEVGAVELEEAGGRRRLDAVARFCRFRLAVGGAGAVAVGVGVGADDWRCCVC